MSDRAVRIVRERGHRRAGQARIAVLRDDHGLDELLDRRRRLRAVREGPHERGVGVPLRERRQLAVRTPHDDEEAFVGLDARFGRRIDQSRRHGAKAERGGKDGGAARLEERPVRRPALVTQSGTDRPDRLARLAQPEALDELGTRTAQLAAQARQRFGEPSGLGPVRLEPSEIGAQHRARRGRIVAPSCLQNELEEHSRDRVVPGAGKSER